METNLIVKTEREETMTKKYQVLEIDKEDSCFVSTHEPNNRKKKNELINKIGFGELTEIKEKPGFFSGGLHLEFIRSVPINKKTKQDKSAPYFENRQSTEYIYFRSVRVAVVGS